MGVDTKLYLNPLTRIEDLLAVLDNYPLAQAFQVPNPDKSRGEPRKLTVKHQVEASNAVPGSMYIYMRIGNPENCRSIWCCANGHSAIGPCLYLSLGCNDEAKALFKYLAEIFGGFLMANDCEGSIKEYMGVVGNDAGTLFMRRAAMAGRVDVTSKFPACAEAAQEEYNAQEKRMGRR